MRKEEYVQAFSQVHAPKALTEKLLQPKLRPNYTRKFAVLAACAVIASILGAFLMGSTDETNPKKTFVSVDWNMYAQLIRAEDETIEVMDQFNIRIEANVSVDDPDFDRMRIELRITPPADFPLIFTPPGNHGDYWNLGSYNLYKEIHGTAGSILEKISVPYYYTAFHTLKPINNAAAEPIYTSFALCPLEKYALMCWEDGEPVYLVASLSPDADPKMIMKYFQYALLDIDNRQADDVSPWENELQRIKAEYKEIYKNLSESVVDGDEESIRNQREMYLYLAAQERALVKQYEQLIREGIWGQYDTE